MVAKARAATPEKVVPVGSLIDRLWAIREDKRALEARIKTLEDEYDGIEEKVKHQLDEQKLGSGRGGMATATIVEADVPQLEDWDRFLMYVRRSGNFQLFERRVSVNAWREVIAKSGKVPSGTKVFTKRKLSLATLKGA